MKPAGAEQVPAPLFPPHIFTVAVGAVQVP